MPVTPLHIISFDNPYPPNYGGTVEVYHKIVALHKAGFTIYLHCFADKIPQAHPELDAITEEVHFYKISHNPVHLFSALPFSVASRSDGKLLDNLLKVKAPIFFESLKTTYLARHKKLEAYTKILRLHNIEQDYFKGIADSERNSFKKFMYRLESKKYKRYESVLSVFDEVLTLSHFETDYVNENYNKAQYVPVFHGNLEIVPLDGFGEYALYHGDLRTPDNRAAVAEIIRVFSDIDYPLVIASGTGEDFVKKLVGNATHVRFEKLQSFGHLQTLLGRAHINIIISFQRSGTKLKLVNALYNSRFCIINNNIIDDAAVASLCVSANSTDAIRKAVMQLRELPYGEGGKRAEVLHHYLNDDESARKIYNTLKNKE